MKIVSIKSLIILLLLAAGAFGLYSYINKGKNTVSYITEPVKRGNIRKMVNATGEVGAANLVSVGTRVSGQIERLYVELGQEVKKGDLIAQIDSTTQKNELSSAKYKLDSYISQLEAAKVSLKVAEIQYKREENLADNDATSKANRENAEKAYASAKSTVTELNSLIRQAQISLSTAQTNLNYTIITAPLDGTVVSTPVKEGQTVNANQTAPTIVQVADLSEMEILIQISEGDVTKVRPGMTLTYTVLSEPGRVYRTTLKSIDPGLTTLTNGSYSGVVDSNAAVYYYGRALVPNTDGSLHIGMTAQSSIITESAENVLMVPSIAISMKGGKRYVTLLNADGTTEEREITTGISDNMNTEVIAGLSENDAVVVAQMTKEEINQSTNSSGAGMRMRL